MQPTLAFFSSLFALSGAAVEQAPTQFGGTHGPDMTRYLIVCALLLLAIAGLGLGFRKLIRRTVAARAAQRSLAIVDVLPMGGKHKLAVVRCYDRTFLLGLGEREIGLISELDATIEPARQAAPSPADAHAFADVLARVRKVAARSREGARMPSEEGVLG
jgi:flagellar biogenesis protein FliO